MKEETAINAEQASVEQVVETVHPLQKNYMFVSTKTVDYENLTAFEAVSLSLVFVLAVTAGVVMSVVA